MNIRSTFARRTLAVLLTWSIAFGAQAGSTRTGELHTPQGSGSGRDFGDFLSDDDAGALNTFYRYYVEVPPATSRLVIDIFDPDIGLGGANEDTAGRDRDRGGYNSSVTYSLLNPAGAARTTQITTGNTTTPAGSDNVWDTLYDATPDFVLDQFGAAAYTNNNGTVNWGGNWIETNDDNNAGTGQIVVNGGRLRIRDGNAGGASTIERQADLSAFATASFSFDLDEDNLDAGDTFRVDVSSNGGGAWTTLATYNTVAAFTGTKTFDITAFRAANTRVRFVAVSGFGNANDTAWVDNVRIGDSAMMTGHWEVRIDMNTDDDIHAFGIRAHDGDTTAGGTELNVYVDSMMSIGRNPPNSGIASRTYQLHPYITGGCACNHHDFDMDADSGNVGSFVYSSRTGVFTQTLATGTLSDTNEWNHDSLTGWTNDSIAGDYGIWELDATINSYLVSGTPNGNYSTIYVGNHLVPASNPTANPVPNAFRIYMPNDAGNAPVKPYMQQQVARGNGAPVVGQMKPVTVSIRINNPTADPITFSTPTNIVTANVPGGAALYGGNAQVTQGTIVSQPAVGGSGNITWDPGPIAAGGSALLAYDVRITPTSAGQRILVTGAANALGNGTRARFVDETANTTQARATYQLGQLCEIAVTEGLLTDVLLSSFEAAVKGGGTVLDWRTASEAGTVGFNVYRQVKATGKLAKVNRNLLLSNVGAPQGGRYRFIDSGNRDSSALYVLEEVTARGKANRYGPYAVRDLPQTEGPAAGMTFDATPRKQNRTLADRRWTGRPTKPVAVMTGVSETGVVRVEASQLATLLAKPLANVQSSIRAGAVSVTSLGRAVGWTATPTADAILFFGEATDSIFSNDRVYRIELGAGSPMTAQNVSPAAAPLSTFSDLRKIETDAFVGSILPVSPDSDYWFWDFVIAGDAEYGRRTFNVTAPAMASSDNAVLSVRLQGALIDSPHRARVSMNGAYVGEIEWNSFDGKVAQLAVPGSVLREGANQVDIEGILGSGASFDIFYVDGFDLRYQRQAKPENGRLEMTLPNGGTVTAGPFGATPIVLNITNRLRPTLVQGASASAGNVSLTVPSTVKSLYFAESTVAPSFMRAVDVSTLAKKNRADYVVIAPSSLASSIVGLTRMRMKEGLEPLVADLNEIYDEFNGGNPSPHAIKDFIDSTKNWTKVPRYFVLAGSGSVDYRGILTDPGLVPPMMVTTRDGLFASDSAYADRNRDGLPDVAIGRIPVANAAELDGFIAKLDANSRLNAASSKVVFSADYVDRGADFKRASQLAETPMDSRPTQKVYIDDVGPANARTALLGAWQSGSPLVSWVGHGGLDSLSNAQILTSGDVPSLTSTGPLPMLVAMTCTINRFEVGFVESLGAALTRTPNAGATAVWSASGLSLHGDAAELQRTFMQLAAAKPGARVGDLIVESLAANPAAAENASIYLLLGDPAMKLSLPNEQVSGPGAPKRLGE